MSRSRREVLAPGDTTTVSIRENSGSNLPGDVVATLTNPATFTSTALNVFTAPADTTLDANTTYWLSVNEGVSSTLTLSFRQTDEDGETGESGWSIGNGGNGETMKRLVGVTQTLL